jgi:hypothetical protein
MKNNVVVTIFEVESEAFQAFTELRAKCAGTGYTAAEAALVRNKEGRIDMLDGFSLGPAAGDDTALGIVVGSLIGILGGPIGVLLGGSYGMLVGSVVDTDDALKGVSMLEQTALKMEEGEVAVIGLAFEENEELLDEKFGKFKAMVIRFDAAAVAAEVEEAQLMADEMARQARKELRDEKKEARKEKREEKKAKLSADWEEFKAKFKKKDKEADA